MLKNDINRPIYSINDPDEEPLYSIDDSISSPLKSNEDYEENDDEDDEDDLDFDLGINSNSEDEDEAKGLSPLRVLFKTMLTPVEGWKALRRAHFSTETFAARCFYPLVAVAALSQSASLFYEANVSLSDWVMKAVVTFVTYFFGYFTILLVGGVVLPKKARPILKKEIGKQFVMLALSTLALFATAINLVPMLDPVLVFLPLWTIYMVMKGVRLMRVPQDCINSTIGFLCMLIIGIPLFWNWIMTELMPLSAAQ